MLATSTLTEKLAALGVHLSAWPEEPEGEDPGDWIKRGQAYADGMRLRRAQLRIASSIESTAGKQLVGILRALGRQSGWEQSVVRYLLCELQDASDYQRVQAAAKLVAASNRTAAQQLGAALEVAKAGFLVCGLDAIKQLVEAPEVNAQECLDLCALLVAQLPLAEGSQEIGPNGESEMWLQNVALHLQATSTLSSAASVAYGEQARAALISQLDTLLTLSEKRHQAPDSDENAALEQVREREQRQRTRTQGKPLLRTIHHLACTGGTVISKCLAAMPDVALISEVNPFNRCSDGFEPTNPLLLLERSYRQLSDNEILEDFARRISDVHTICRQDDVDLIIRDHSHTDFCIGAQPSTFRPIADYLSTEYEMLSAVTVRHPLDSYLGILANGWEKQFIPSTLNEYSRRYLAFLERYISLPILRYEDFCACPETFMRQLCEILEVGYSAEFQKHFRFFTLSGDSGRKGLDMIEQRPRRPAPDVVQSELNDSHLYLELVSRLGY